MTKPKPESGEFEFDANKSQASMPRLYEHIDRVDLWIMAQRQYHNAAARQVEELRAEVERLEHTVLGFDKINSIQKTYLEAAEKQESALRAQAERLAVALERFAKIEADDGDDFEGVHEDVILRVEVTAGDIHEARATLQQYRDGGRES